MKLQSYVMIALVVLATSTPTLALAEYENEGGQPDMMILSIFSLTLYITIFAILGVVGYSIWKVLRIRRNAAKMRLV
jgi:heme/copper-type cytochrome/quinol oxidase subunit 2